MTRNRWISDLHWVREGQQSRSQKTQTALMDAATALFAEQGIAATSVADIARQAGCSVGAVYHHFKDKQTLLYALFDRLCSETELLTEQALDPNRWEGARLSDILHGYLEFTLTKGRDHARFKRAIKDYARQQPDMGEKLEEQAKRFNEGLIELMMARKSEIQHPDPRLAIAMVLDQLSGLLSSRLGESTHYMAMNKRSDEVFVREALSASLAYLQVSAKHR